MNFHIARASTTTGNLLRTLVMANLEEEGHVDAQDSQICYGAGYAGNLPALNKHCSRYSKLEQAKLLQEGLGLGALEVFETAASAQRFLNDNENIPVLLGRSLVHTKGKDIRMAFEPWQIPPLLASGTSFFTAYQDSVREFRTWVYRKRHLGTYEKMLRRPEDYKRVGRNYDNGFDFSGVENELVPEALKEIARNAIKILGLDFGAVDVLQAPNGRLVVLEVNSAPGVSDERRRVIQALAKRVSRWIINGCPAREA